MSTLGDFLDWFARIWSAIFLGAILLLIWDTLRPAPKTEQAKKDLATVHEIARANGWRR